MSILGVSNAVTGAYQHMGRTQKNTARGASFTERAGQTQEVSDADPRCYQTTVKEFLTDRAGNVKKAKLVKLEPQKDEKTGRVQMIPVEGSEYEIETDLVLIAAGFLDQSMDRP